MYIMCDRQRPTDAPCVGRPTVAMANGLVLDLTTLPAGKSIRVMIFGKGTFNIYIQQPLSFPLHDMRCPSTPHPLTHQSLYSSGLPYLNLCTHRDTHNAGSYRTNRLYMAAGARAPLYRVLPYVQSCDPPFPPSLFTYQMATGGIR